MPSELDKAFGLPGITITDIENTEDGQPRIVVRLASDLVSLGYVYINKGFFPEELSSLTEY